MEDQSATNEDDDLGPTSTDNEVSSPEHQLVTNQDPQLSSASDVRDAGDTSSELASGGVSSINIPHQIPEGELNPSSSKQQPADSSQTSSQNANDPQAAIEKIRKLQKKYAEEVVIRHGLTALLQKDIPDVQPRMVKATITKEATSKKEKYNPSQQEENLQHEMEITFQDLLNICQDSKFLSVVGGLGTGKSTTAKKVSNQSNLTCFMLKFMNMNDDQDLTLRELLLDNNYPELSEEECQLAFEWIVQNDDQCLFILEGYNQCNWTLNQHPSMHPYQKPQTKQNLISNLCHKEYLPRSKILLTSLSHSMVSIPKSIRSDFTILLQDLSIKDMKKLFFAFAESKAQEAWDHLHATAPQLVSACLNPLMLQLIVEAFLRSGSNITEISTITRVFVFVLENLRSSDFTHLDDIGTIRDKVSTLAFKATNMSNVVMKLEDLQAVDLDLTTAQNIIIAFFHHRQGFTGVFEGKENICFLNQSFQEYFSARYICHLMSYDDFKKFVETKLFTSHWSVVAKFLFGLVLDLNEMPETDDDVGQQSLQMVIKEEAQSKEIILKTSSLEIADNLTTKKQSKKSQGDGNSKFLKMVSKIRSILHNTPSENQSKTKQRGGILTFLEGVKKLRSLLFDDVLQQYSQEVLKKDIQSKEITSIKSNPTIAESHKRRAHILKEALLQKFNEYPSGRKLINLCNLVRECNNDVITTEAANRFPDAADLSDTFISSSDAHAVALVVRKVGKKIKMIDLGGCRLTTESFSYISHAIESMHGSVDMFDVSYNILSASSTGDITKILNKINELLRMKCCYKDEYTSIKQFPSSERKFDVGDTSKCLQEKSLMIGRNGGKIELEDYNQCYVEFPPASVDKDVNFTISLKQTETKDKVADEFILTPTLHCSPSMNFHKPVTISLPTCYEPDYPEVEVVPQTYDGNKWIDEEAVPHGGKGFIVFKTESFCSKLVKTKKHRNGKCYIRSKNFRYMGYQNQSTKRPCLVWKIEDYIQRKNFTTMLEKDFAFRGLFNLTKSDSLTLSIQCPNDTSVKVTPTQKNLKIMFQNQYFEEEMFSVKPSNETKDFEPMLFYSIRGKNENIKSGHFPFSLLVRTTNEDHQGPPPLSVSINNCIISNSGIGTDNRVSNNADNENLGTVSFSNDRRRWRDLNENVKRKLQEALDRLESSKLEVWTDDDIALKKSFQC